jgi:hypothetical protein
MPANRCRESDGGAFDLDFFTFDPRFLEIGQASGDGAGINGRRVGGCHRLDNGDCAGRVRSKRPMARMASIAQGGGGQRGVMGRDVNGGEFVVVGVCVGHFQSSFVGAA